MIPVIILNLVGLWGEDSNFGLIRVIITPSNTEVPKQINTDHQKPMCLFFPMKCPINMAIIALIIKRII